SLDPTKSASENLSHLFKRYQKAVRKLTKAGAQQEGVRAATEEVSRLAAEFQGIVERGEAGEADLRGFAERPEIRRLLARFAPLRDDSTRSAAAPTETKLGKQTVPNRLVPRRYRSSEGLEIWVGRSDAGNDYLTTRLARGKDLFFHLDGAPGSHVILRTEGRTDPPSESVLEACELAVHFSKLKNAGSADIHIVPIKNVKKPKGAKPGLVQVRREKVIRLRREPARLARLLGS
ncbi:MAG: NFACT RNA binding domain-containing protein, partial [Planctomycetota bacterium]|nr:NFACT RNA binding domain-containing protein [Planctomycetota bacterium]